MKSISLQLCALIIGTTALIAGCGGGQLQARDDPGAIGSPYSANDALASRVRAALAADARVGVESLTIKVVNNVVELGGSPKNLQARDLALSITGRVPGVRSVLNNMVMN